MLLGYTYPILSIFWSIFIFFGFVVWFYLLFVVFADLFRDSSESGLSKALWTICILFLPLIGVLMYLVVRGSGMQQRTMARAQEQQAAIDDYIRRTAASAPSSTSTVDGVETGTGSQQRSAS